MVRSTALAAAGARLTGLISIENLLESVEIELETMGIAGQPLQSNLDLVREVFGALDPATHKEREDRTCLVSQQVDGSGTDKKYRTRLPSSPPPETWPSERPETGAFIDRKSIMRTATTA